MDYNWFIPRNKHRIKILLSTLEKEIQVVVVYYLNFLKNLYPTIYPLLITLNLMEVGSQGFKSGAILCVLLIGIVLVIKPKTYNAT